MHAAGTYTLRLKGSSDAAKVGSASLRRDVTYPATAAKFAGCHETGEFVGTWGFDVDGTFWTVIQPWSGQRSGCAAPGDDRPTFAGNTTGHVKSLVNGAAQLTACALTIGATTYVKLPAAATASGG